MTGRILPMFAVAILLTTHSLSQDTRGRVIAQEGGGGLLINDLDQSTVAMHPATPYLESSTLLLADFDLTKIDVEATAKWMQELNDQGELDPSAIAMARGFLDSIRGAGGEHAFVTAATRSLFDGGPIVIVPSDNPAVVNGLLTVLVQNLPKKPPQEVQVDDLVVLAGSVSALQRVTASEGTDRPDLILPTKLADRLDHTAVFALPAEARNDLKALWPDKMPPSSQLQFSPATLAADISKIIVSLRLPPDAAMRVSIEAPHANAAHRVREVIEKMIALDASTDSRLDMKVELATVTIQGDPEAFAKVAMALISPARKSASQMQTLNSMKQIGLAIHNYFSKEKHLPPRCFTDPRGVPLLSIRVALLPHLDQIALYRAFHLDEAWDSEHNRTFTDMRLPVYSDAPAQTAKTRIRFPVYPGSIWQGDGPPHRLRDITDGTSNTIAAIHAPPEAAVDWTDPTPWVISEQDPMSDVFGDRETACVVLMDGSGQVLHKSKMTNEKLKAMLTMAGGESFD